MREGEPGPTVCRKNASARSLASVEVDGASMGASKASRSPWVSRRRGLSAVAGPTEAPAEACSPGALGPEGEASVEGEVSVEGEALVEGAASAGA
jgi:hypothetical protein